MAVFTNVAIVAGISKEKGGDVNFDECISPDGNTLYFDDGVYTRPDNYSVPASRSRSATALSSRV